MRIAVVKKLAGFVLIIPLAVILVGCTTAPQWRDYQRGQMKAERDISRGAYIMRWSVMHCFPSPAGIEYPGVLRDWYDIERRFRPPPISARAKTEIAGYTDFLHAHLEQRFGTNLWNDAWDEAIRRASAKSKAGNVGASPEQVPNIP
jgi:hypothetical protein